MTDPKTCANCGTRLAGPWCHACGQRDRDVRRAIWDVLGDAVSEGLELDGRLPRTAGAFFTRPGFLVQEFVAGRRRSWTSPVRILVFAVFVSFLVFGWASDRSVSRLAALTGDAPVEVHDGKMVIRLTESGDSIDFGVDDGFVRGAAERLGGLPNRVAASIVIGAWLAGLPLVVAVVLVPALALLLEVAFPRFLVIEHLLLSVHVHAFALLAFAAGVLVSVDGAALVALAAPVVYLGLAMRRIYAQPAWRIGLKLAFVGAAHAIVLLAASLGLLAGVLAWM